MIYELQFFQKEIPGNVFKNNSRIKESVKRTKNVFEIYKDGDIISVCILSMQNSMKKKLASMFYSRKISIAVYVYFEIYFLEKFLIKKM